MLRLCVLVLVASVSSFLSHYNLKSRFLPLRVSGLVNFDSEEPPVLLPVETKSIETFVDPLNENKIGLECFTMYNARIKNAAYAIGYPIDTPVALTYFEKGDLKQVSPNIKEYQDLLEHVSDHLTGGHLELLDTAMVLTVRGEYEDEDMNDIFPVQPPQREAESDSEELPARQLYGREFEDLLFSKELDEPDENENLDNPDRDPDDNDDQDDDDFGQSEADSVNNEETGDSRGRFRVDSQKSKAPELSEEEIKDLRLRHKVAERVMAHALDLKLMGSFYFRKKVYHLVHLLEVQPILDQLAIQEKTTAPVTGVHTKKAPKYSNRASDMLTTPSDGADDQGVSAKRPRQMTPFQAAQRKWYAQKAASNTRPGLSGYEYPDQDRRGGGGGNRDRRQRSY